MISQTRVTFFIAQRKYMNTEWSHSWRSPCHVPCLRYCRLASISRAMPVCNLTWVKLHRSTGTVSSEPGRLPCPMNGHASMGAVAAKTCERVVCTWPFHVVMTSPATYTDIHTQRTGAAISTSILQPCGVLCAILEANEPDMDWFQVRRLPTWVCNEHTHTY